MGELSTAEEAVMMRKVLGRFTQTQKLNLINAIRLAVDQPTQPGPELPCAAHQAA
jgi:hypothetical protein